MSRVGGAEMHSNQYLGLLFKVSLDLWCVVQLDKTEVEWYQETNNNNPSLGFPESEPTLSDV